MLRRAVYAVVVIMMTDYPALQLMTLVFTSGLISVIVLRGRPFLTSGIKWSMAIFEILFAWTCIAFIIFSAEYVYRSYTIVSDVANAVSILAACVIFHGLIWLMYSLCWQI